MSTEDLKISEHHEDLNRLEAKLDENQKKIDAEHLKRDQFLTKRKTIFGELSVCRARKTEIYAQVEQLRLRLSDFDKKRMENRKYHLEGRSLKFSDVKSLDEHVASLKKALKEGNTEAQTQIDSTTSDRSKVIAFESFLKSETKQEEQSAGFRVQIEGLNAENQTLRKKEQQFMAAISDLSKNEDVFFSANHSIIQ